MEEQKAKNITNEILMEQILEMKSMIENLQSEIQSMKNPVAEFNSNWVDTYDVMQMLRVSRRTMDNYIKAGKLTPTRIRKRNYFAIEDVKGLMHVPQLPQISSFRSEAQTLMSRLAKIEKAGGES